MSQLLQVKDISMQFGGLMAVQNVSFHVNTGEIFALIGPNGAGKTTVFNCISGFYCPTAGQIEFAGHATAGLPSHKIARLGMVRTFQNIRLFGTMTVVENLLVAQHTRLVTNLWSGLINSKGYRRSEKEAMERATFWLDVLGLREVANREAGTLAYGQQRLLEIGRCMVTGPKLLMLDEPAAGLNPQETKELDELLMKLRKEHDLTVVLIEHDMRLIMGISDRIVVLDQGQHLATGTPAEIQNNPDVIKAYLGEA